MRREDMNLKAILYSAAALALFAALIQLVLIWFHGYLPKARSEPQSIATLATPLEIDSGKSLDAVRRAENLKLSSYGWINRKNNIVRIPIHRAIELRAAKESSRGKND